LGAGARVKDVSARQFETEAGCDRAGKGVARRII
jgi:hypothetical protein